MPAILAQVDVAAGVPQQVEMGVPMLQGLGASAKLAICHLAGDAPAQAAAPQLTSWKRQGDTGRREVEVVAALPTERWEPRQRGSSSREDPRDAREAAMPSGSPPIPARRPITCLARKGAGGKQRGDQRPPTPQAWASTSARTSAMPICEPGRQASRFRHSFPSLAQAPAPPEGLASARPP